MAKASRAYTPAWTDPAHESLKACMVQLQLRYKSTHGPDAHHRHVEARTVTAMRGTRHVERENACARRRHLHESRLTKQKQPQKRHKKSTQRTVKIRLQNQPYPSPSKLPLPSTCRHQTRMPTNIQVHMDVTLRKRPCQGQHVATACRRSMGNVTL